jgi:V/A-type H+-transporting ATPase subunit C
MGRNSYLQTRVAIMRARLLPETYFSPYIEAELDSSFSSKAGIAPQINEINPLYFDRLLMRTLLDELAIISRPLTGVANQFFVSWARRFELFNLKTIIRGKQNRIPYEVIEKQLQEIPAYATLPIEALLQCDDLQELLRLIEQSAYSAIARQVRRVKEENHDPHAVEAAIDQYYYNNLLKKIDLLEDEDCEPLRDLLGVQIDKLNLMWLIRYRFNYGLSPTETYYHLIRPGRYLKRSNLLQLSEQENLEDLIAMLPAVILQSLHNRKTAMDIEFDLEKWVRGHARKSVQHDHSILTRALAYLLLRECDLRHVRTMMIGKQLNIDHHLLEKAMGHRAVTDIAEGAYV